MHLGQVQKEIVAAGIIADLPDTVIARQIGMSHTTVGKARNMAEVNALVEAGFKEISGAWTKAVNNVKHVVEEFQKPIPDGLKGVQAKAALQKREQGFKASERLVESMGLLPSHSAPTYITNLMQVNNNFISPVVDQVLDKTFLDVQIIDSLNDPE